jgi:hypothetical protein
VTISITEVTYRALRTGRGYNNTSVEAKAAVPATLTPEAVLSDLRMWVERQIDAHLELDDAWADLQSAQRRAKGYKEEAEQLQKKIDAQRKVLQEHSKLAEIARREGLGGPAMLLEMGG